MHQFAKHQIESSRPDGYWVEDFPFRIKDTRSPNLVGYGLGTSSQASKIQMFANPFHGGDLSVSGNAQWPKTQIAELEFPVAFSYADITGNGYNDIILSDQYGSSMKTDIWADGGRVSWFENTGNAQTGNWSQRYIGKSPGMHRLRAGHFTSKDKVQIIAVPIIVKSGDYTSPAPVIIYTAPESPKDTKDEEGWPHQVVFEQFRLVHEVTVVPGVDGGLDHVLLAGREGITLIWYDTDAKKWMSENIGTGLPESKPNPYWGSASVDVAKVHDDAAGYIATCEAFHGNLVTIYTKDKSARTNTLAGVNWTRHVLEDFGPLDKDEFTGSIHQVVCADIDGDGVDEILVALMGSDPPSWNKTGVWCYKLVDLEKGRFTKYKLSDDSAGRIAVADFMGRGILDFATISYSVPNYFESPSPSINVYFNTPITAEKLDNEVLFRVPRPSMTYNANEVEFLDVSGRRLALVVVPPNRAYAISSGVGVKVIAGRLSWTDKDKNFHERTLGTRAFREISTVVNSADGCVHTDSEGAVVVFMKKSKTSGQPPYSDMKQLDAHNIFPGHFVEAVRHLQFPWYKVEDLPWANGGFKGLEFYNLTGFYVRYADDSDDLLCHIQLWTAGVGVSAGFHNHADKSFCEIHACIVNGTGKGGMSWATVDDDSFDPAHPDPDQYKSLVVPDMTEHGPLWRTSGDGLPILRTNDTVNYPWHAWIAGDGDASQQRFDVWLAFEFPSFIARLEEEISTNAPEPGLYHIYHAASDLALGVKDGEVVDGTPLILDDNANKHEWEVSVVPGTAFRLLKNTKASSMATAAWPPTANQTVVSSCSPAKLGVTTAWALKNIGSGQYEMRLIDTDLVIAADVPSGQDNSKAPKAFSFMTLLGFGSRESSQEAPKASISQVSGSDQVYLTQADGGEAQKWVLKPIEK